MFSGLVVYRGTVVAKSQNRDGAFMRIKCEGVKEEKPAPTDSIAINGVCLTVTYVEESGIIWFDVVPETIACSTLGELKRGDAVNVEYALRVGNRIGGHLVYGHVDRTVRVLAVAGEGQGKRMRLERPSTLAYAIVPKAFVALDGISLTVAAARGKWFEVAFIPETLARTTFAKRRVGNLVNIEIDPIARYVQKR